MAGFLLDTNVISEIRKPNGNPDVKAWVAGAPGPALHLSAMTFGEIRCGIDSRRKRDPAQAEILESWLVRLYFDFRDRIAPITATIAEEWGRLNNERPLPVADGLIAATARVNGWTVVSRNEKDFKGTGVPLINPFEPLS